MSSTLQFIAQVKLGELRKQRTLLIDVYDRCLRDAANGTPQERLRTLYDGLRAIRCAGRQLHLDVVNLEILLNNNSPSAEVLEHWIKRLEKEAAAGRMRAEIVYLFGALLGEWGRSAEESERFQHERQQAHARLIAEATRPAEANRHAPLFEKLFGTFGGKLNEVRENIQKLIRRNRPMTYDVFFLSDLQRDIYQPAHLRKEAERFAKDEILAMELSSALQMSLPNPSDWNWPDDGIEPRTLWTRNKWRMYLTQELPAFGHIEGIAHHWAHVFDDTFANIGKRMNFHNRLKKLLELKAPDVIIDNERRMIRREEERIDFGWYEPKDPWDGSVTEPDSLSAQRAIQQVKARQTGPRGYYGGQGYGGATPGVGLVHAEVQTLRAAFPDRPLFVAKLDIRDFYPSIPHDVILTMLAGFGLQAGDLTFFERFLQVPLRVDGKVVQVRRGVAMDQTLSHFLADLLMQFLEKYVHTRASVRIIRVIDDITLLAPNEQAFVDAWRAIHEFTEACGLAVNDAKCGAVAIGGALPAGLPTKSPCWGMLQLQSDGSWGVHEATFASHLAETRERVLTTHSILARVNLYNAHLRFLTGALGLTLDLGDAHRDAINEALRRFHREFFGSGKSIVEGLAQTIGERYLQDSRVTELPESWLYWPVTAGGAALRNPAVLVGQYNEAFAERQQKRMPAPASRPDDWQTGDADWAAYYHDVLETIKPIAPKDTAVMKTLVQDFISRGQEISGGKQTDLSDYWRWILYVYGPEILDKLGTFRFLITELVPLQLIHEQLLHDSSLDAPAPENSTESASDSKSPF